MKNIITILAVAVLTIAGCGRSLEKKSSYRAGYDFSGVTKVAIVSVEGVVPSELARDQIADFFAIELLENGYAPMGRAQVRALLTEEDADVEDLTTPEGAVEAGLILDVPAVLTIRIPHFGEEISITGSMIDVEDRSMLWIATGSGRGAGGFSMFGPRSRGGVDEGLLGPIMGDVLGDTGEPLSTADAERAQRIIRDMCRTLPRKLATAPEW